MIELSLILGSPYAWRVQLALEFKGLDYETRVLSMARGDLQSAAFLALSPRGRVPLLRDGDFHVTESIAILAYLEARYPARPLFGTTPEQSATVWQKISEYTSYVDTAVEDFILPLYFDRAESCQTQVRQAAEILAHEFASYDRVFAQRPFLAGDDVTGADLVVFPHVLSVLRASGKPAATSFDLPFLPLGHGFPHLARWKERIEGLPGYERTYPPHWK